MRVLLQRVAEAQVRVEGQIVGEIAQGFLLLVGVAAEDTKTDAAWLAQKVAKMRVFSDDAGKMNLNIAQVSGKILSVSQFTLYADIQRGNRPSFIAAARPEHGKALFEYFNQCLSQQGLEVCTGVFGADMKVTLLNDGPVTLWLDSQVAR